MPLNYPSETERSKPARKLGSYRVVYFVANIANPLAVNVGILNNDVSFPSGCWSTIYNWFSYILSVFSHLAIDAVQRRRYHVIECSTGRRIDAVRWNSTQRSWQGGNKKFQSKIPVDHFQINFFCSRLCCWALKNVIQKKSSSSYVDITNLLPIAFYRSTEKEVAGLRIPVNYLLTSFFIYNINWFDYTAPPYHTRHTVLAAPWSFIDRTDLTVVPESEEKQVRYADLSVPPPYHPPPQGFQVNLISKKIILIDSNEIIFFIWLTAAQCSISASRWSGRRSHRWKRIWRSFRSYHVIR